MRHTETIDESDPRTTRMEIEPAVCDECRKRAKCLLRVNHEQHKCPALRRGKR
jgi:hypothetical protein